MKTKLAIISLLLLISITGFSSPVDSLSIEILQKTLDNHRSLDSICFHYSYTVQIMDQDFNWAEEKEQNEKWTVTKNDLESENIKDDRKNDSYFHYINTLYTIQKALEIKKTRLSCGCSPLPYYVINLSDIPFRGFDSMKYYKNQTVYIDTVTYLVHAITTAVNLDSGKVQLTTFTMDSVKAYYPIVKPSPMPFQLNKHMLQPGEMAPEFSLKDPEGNTINLSDYKGKLVLLDFWYSACKPCIKASYNLEDLQKKYANRGLVVLGMNTMDKDDKARRHNKKHHITYNTTLCSRDIKAAYKIHSYPSFYLIDQTGKIVFSTSGYSSNLSAELESAILQALSNR